MSFISDIRTITNLYLPLFMLSMDSQLEFSVYIEKLFIMISKACCTKKLKDPLENVSTEVMDEVDLIFRNYVIIDPTKQALPGAILIEK